MVAADCNRVRRRDSANARSRDAGREQPASEAARVGARFMEMVLREPALIEIENAHHIDEASAEFLSYLTGTCATALARSRSRAVVQRASSRRRTGQR